MGYWLCASNDIEDLRVNIWYWGATVSLIQKSRILKEGEEIFGDRMIFAEEKSCLLLADWLEKNVIVNLPSGSRIKLSGEVTTKPADGTFHREDLDENYSVDREWLTTFVAFLRECGGFFTLG